MFNLRSPTRTSATYLWQIRPVRTRNRPVSSAIDQSLTQRNTPTRQHVSPPPTVFLSPAATLDWTASEEHYKTRTHSCERSQALHRLFDVSHSLPHVELGVPFERSQFPLESEHSKLFDYLERPPLTWRCRQGGRPSAIHEIVNRPERSRSNATGRVILSVGGSPISFSVRTMRFGRDDSRGRKGGNAGSGCGKRLRAVKVRQRSQCCSNSTETGGTQRGSNGRARVGEGEQLT